MNKTDQVYLEDMLDSIIKIDQFLDGYDFNSFQDDDKTIFAVLRALEIIGEAANKLSVDFANQNLDFPVRQAVEMRNFLIHGYDQINLKIVWKTVQDNLLPLKTQIQLYLGLS